MTGVQTCALPISDILDIDEGDISDGFGPDDAPLWDSMNNLRLITALEENFRIKLTMEEIETMINFGEIKKVAGLDRKSVV